MSQKRNEVQNLDVSRSNERAGPMGLPSQVKETIRRWSAKGWGVRIEHQTTETTTDFRGVDDDAR